jgi:hypothetical protein
MNSATGRVECPIVIITSGTDDFMCFITKVRYNKHDYSEGRVHMQNFKVSAKQPGEENRKRRRVRGNLHADICRVTV